MTRSTAEAPYQIGLYERYEDIPPGTHGYLVAPRHPAGIRGPFEVRTPEDLAVLQRLNELREAEMTQESAPRELSQLLAIAGATEEDTALWAERERILGADIHFLNIEDGVTGKITGMKMGGEGDAETLILTLAGATRFGPGWEATSDKLVVWEFVVPRITDYQLLSSSRFRTTRFQCHGRDYNIERRYINPEVQEAAAQAKAVQKAETARFAGAIASGDYDPRLTEFGLFAKP